MDTLASAALRIRARGSQDALERLATALRALSYPVIGRISEGALLLDLRCLDEADEASFLATVSELDAAGLAAHRL
jgi:L-seryl-tRNA(Ser) seleniumtransferase